MLFLKEHKLSEDIINSEKIVIQIGKKRTSEVKLRVCSLPDLIRLNTAGTSS